MATTIFSPVARIFSCSTTTTSTTSPKPAPPPPSKINQLLTTTTTGHQIPTKSPLGLGLGLQQQVINLAATALATGAILTTPPSSLALAAAAEATDTAPNGAANNYSIYYGTAASAANYGGYGGNSDKKTSAEYVYDVPMGWKERLVSKVEKGTNGTDSEFYNPKKKAEKEYLTYLAGFRQLAPKEAVLNNLALSDVNLQDLIASAESVKTEERKDEENGGQVYYVYEIQGVGAHSLISVTCANNKLYAHFVNAPTPDWNRDQDTLRHIHHSFKTLA